MKKKLMSKSAVLEELYNRMEKAQVHLTTGCHILMNISITHFNKKVHKVFCIAK